MQRRVQTDEMASWRDGLGFLLADVPKIRFIVSGSWAETEEEAEGVLVLGVALSERTAAGALPAVRIGAVFVASGSCRV